MTDKIYDALRKREVFSFIVSLVIFTFWCVLGYAFLADTLKMSRDSAMTIYIAVTLKFLIQTGSEIYNLIKDNISFLPAVNFLFWALVLIPASVIKSEVLQSALQISNIAAVIIKIYIVFGVVWLIFKALFAFLKDVVY